MRIKKPESNGDKFRDFFKRPRKLLANKFKSFNVLKSRNDLKWTKPVAWIKSYWENDVYLQVYGKMIIFRVVLFCDKVSLAGLKYSGDDYRKSKPLSPILYAKNVAEIKSGKTNWHPTNSFPSEHFQGNALFLLVLRTF